MIKGLMDTIYAIRYLPNMQSLAGTKGALRRKRLRYPSFSTHHKQEVKRRTDIQRRREDRRLWDVVRLGAPLEEVWPRKERALVDTWD